MICGRLLNSIGLQRLLYGGILIQSLRRLNQRASGFSFFMKTPKLTHFTKKDFEEIYEPMEDTFLLLDTLEEDLDFISSRNPTIVMEIGSGSGCVITFCSQLLLGPRLYLATDINIKACLGTLKTAESNAQQVECINTKFNHGLRILADLLIFNPPYVVTPSEEVGSFGIEASWAGGIDGLEVTNEFLANINQMLSPSGILYMILINENRPKEIISEMSRKGFHGQVMKYRVAGREGLSCVRFTRNMA